MKVEGKRQGDQVWTTIEVRDDLGVRTSLEEGGKWFLSPCMFAPEFQ